MFQIQLVIGLLIGFKLNAVNKLTNALPLKNTDDQFTGINLDLTFLGKSLYGKLNISMGERLKTAFIKKHKLPYIVLNPEEQGTYLESDLLIPVDNNGNDFNLKFHYWADDYVPYELSPTFEEIDVEKIKTAMMKIQADTCVRFKERKNEKDYVYIDDKDYGCFSAVGNVGRGQQILNLQKPYCLKEISTIEHELMHTLGFLHEHNRFERDEFINITWKNVAEGKEENFKKWPVRFTFWGYDYASIMHYSHFFSNKKSGLITIWPMYSNAEALKMGQRRDLSPGDVKKIQYRYCTKMRKSTHQKGGGIKMEFNNDKDTVMDLLFNPEFVF